MKKKGGGGTDFHGSHHFMAVVRCRGGDERHQQVLKLTMGVSFHVLQ